jgi:amidase
MPLTRRQAVLQTAVLAASTNSSRAASSSSAAAAPDLCFLTARELAARLRKKSVSAREVLQAHLRQIERVNPKVNAIVTLVADQAMAKAAQLDEGAAKGRFAGALHGLPIAHKDLVETKGIRTTYGSPIHTDNIPAANALIVDRIQTAGAVTIGKTNTPEFGAGSQTFNKVFGATKNPYDLSKTCGGSSGGAAVALACGMLPIADGSEMGGSLRNPASFCSVTGFRVSPGRIPAVNSGSIWSPLSVLGPMARNAADVALLLSAIAGPDVRSPMSIQEPGSRFLEPLERKMKGVRVAWCAGGIPGMPFDPRVLRLFESQRKTLAALGCVIEEAQPDFSGADEAFRILRALAFYQMHGPKLQQYRDLMKATVIEEVERGAKLTGPQVADAEVLRGQLCARVGEFLSKYEYFMLPVVQVPPFDVTTDYVIEINGQKMQSYIEWMRSCYYITMTGLPALSVPGGFTEEGLPVGLQIVGRPQADFAVLQMAHAFETARGPLPAPKIAIS